MLALRTILHPSDFSEHSQLAFRLASALARDYGATLHVLHVEQPPAAFYGEGMLTALPEDYKKELDTRLRQLQPHDTKVPIEHRLVEGDPAAEILRAAEALRSDLIVMGTHGRSGLGRLVLGSVAEQVMRGAPCPVLTVKKPLPGLDNGTTAPR